MRRQSGREPLDAANADRTESSSGRRITTARLAGGMMVGNSRRTSLISRVPSLLIVAIWCAFLPGCSASTSSTPTAADAKAFLDTVDGSLKKLLVEGGQAGWVAQNFITEDTEALDAR